MIYLLDTNACVEYLRQRSSSIIRRIAAARASDIVLCSIVKAELYHGAYRSQQVETNLAKIENFERAFVSIPFDDHTARVYGRIRAELETQGVVIGPYDLQIAAIALVHDLTLVTHNIDEFNRVPGIRCEDWQTEA